MCESKVGRGVERFWNDFDPDARITKTDDQDLMVMCLPVITIFTAFSDTQWPITCHACDGVFVVI